MTPSSTGSDPEALSRAAVRASSRLADWQSSEGLWPNLLEGGPYLDVLYALGVRMLRRAPALQAQMDGAWVRRLLASQNADGGFALWHGGPSHFTAGIEAYLALRLAGLPADNEKLRALGSWIASQGGLDRCPASTWVKLVWSGAASDERLESIPPEHFFFLDYRRFPPLLRQQAVCDAALSVAAYLRGAAQPSPQPQAPAMRSELPPSPATTEKTGFDLYGLTGVLISRWARFAPRALRDPIVFRAYDAMVREAQLWPTLPVAIHAALAVEAAGGRGSAALSGFERTLSWLAPSSAAAPPRPCDFGIRQAALALLALAGALPAGALESAASSLESRFRTIRESAPGAPAAGWPLGDLHASPDAETTALVLLALRRVSPHFQPGHELIRSASTALAGAQREDGGWSPGESCASAPDITATVLEALLACGHPPSSPAIARAVLFLENSQHAEAWWDSARGVHRLHGTALALRALRAADVDEREAVILRAGEWIRSIQNADGGWGEAPAEIAAPLFTPAPSTPAQTAWALLGLLASGDSSSESIRRGFSWLLERQRPDGGWDAAAPCLAGVAGAPFLADPLGAVAWPLLALRERLSTLATP
jgi:squalene-hopene/tetraprenyl-beta-curcumene cyclase